MVESSTQITELSTPKVVVGGEAKQGEGVPSTTLEIGALVQNPDISRAPEGAPIMVAESTIGTNFEPVAGEVAKPKAQAEASDQKAQSPITAGLQE